MPDHHHHHHGDGCGHEHDDDDHLKTGEGQQDTLWGRVDRENVVALNEREAGMAKETIKPYDQRLDETKFVESDVDDQLIVRVPFVGAVKLRSLIVKAGPEQNTPSEIHLYVNREELDFDEASSGQPAPTQALKSIAVAREAIEYPLKATKFSNVRTLHLFVPAALGADSTRIYYIGFKGEWLGVQRREGPTNIVYESAPQVKDHAKIPGTDMGSHHLGPGS